MSFGESSYSIFFLSLLSGLMSHTNTLVSPMALHRPVHLPSSLSRLVVPSQVVSLMRLSSPAPSPLLIMPSLSARDYYTPFQSADMHRISSVISIVFKFLGYQFWAPLLSAFFVSEQVILGLDNFGFGYKSKFLLPRVRVIVLKSHIVLLASLTS